MATVEHALSRGTRRASSIRDDLGAEVRRARIEHGLSQTLVARSARISRSQLSRIERGEAPRLTILVVCRLLAVLGMELSARAYPSGRPIRDAAHLALLDRLRTRVGSAVKWHYEQPVGGEGDMRAWDARVANVHVRVGVETETRVRDVQALQRRMTLRLRDDDRVDCALLVLAYTRHNRAIVRENLEALRADFPIDGEAALEAIAAGRHPGGNAIVLL